MKTNFILAGKSVRCPHCEHTEFDAREILLNTRTATFFNCDWLNRGATTLTCKRCSHIEWFNLTLEEMSAGGADKSSWLKPNR
jgi:predicted nucleic-acid-binding Zn-ribbon protein